MWLFSPGPNHDVNSNNMSYTPPVWAPSRNLDMFTGPQGVLDSLSVTASCHPAPLPRHPGMSPTSYDIQFHMLCYQLQPYATPHCSQRHPKPKTSFILLMYALYTPYFCSAMLSKTMASVGN